MLKLDCKIMKQTWGQKFKEIALRTKKLNSTLSKVKYEKFRAFQICIVSPCRPKNS